MKQTRIGAAIFGIVLATLVGCEEAENPDLDQTIVGVVDESDLNSIMLTVADPGDAVEYFRNAVSKDATREDLWRGLGKSYIRDGQPTLAVATYERLLSMEGATPQDRVDYADALVRTNDWKGAERELDKVPPNVQTFQRYRLEAMIADANKQWSDADEFYKTASNLTTQPANILNNWGYSKLTRGDNKGAETLFAEAIRNNPRLFAAKNNMALARASQRNYTLPIIPMTETEKAQLLYTLGLSAVKQKDREIGVRLIREAVETHPEFFEEAQRSLDALTGTVAN